MGSCIFICKLQQPYTSLLLFSPLNPLCHPNLWPVPSVFQTQTETKGQENPCGTVSRGQPHLGHRVSREERQDLGVVWSMENSQKQPIASSCQSKLILYDKIGFSPEKANMYPNFLAFCICKLFLTFLRGIFVEGLYPGTKKPRNHPDCEALVTLHYALLLIMWCQFGIVHSGSH